MMPSVGVFGGEGGADVSAKASANGKHSSASSALGKCAIIAISVLL